MSQYQKEYYAKNKERKQKNWNDWARTLKGQFNVSKRKARYHGKEWTITLEQYSILRSKACYYCAGNLPDTSRGLDRIDNSKGYSLDNVLPCCGFCNSVRSNLLTVEETLAVITLVKQMRNKSK